MTFIFILNTPFSSGGTQRRILSLQERENKNYMNHQNSNQNYSERGIHNHRSIKFVYGYIIEKKSTKITQYLEHFLFYISF